MDLQIHCSYGKKPNDFTNYTCTCVHCIAHHSISELKCQHFRRYVVFILLFFHQKPKMRDYSVHGFSTSIFRCGSASIPQIYPVLLGKGKWIIVVLILWWYYQHVQQRWDSREKHILKIFIYIYFIVLLFTTNEAIEHWLIFVSFNRDWEWKI